jgi:hypothetical protein
MTVQSGDGTFVRLSFTGLGLTEPLHVFLGLGNSANDLLDVELAVRQLPHPSLGALVSASLECVPVHLSDDTIGVAGARLLSRGYRREERESCKCACNYTPHGENPPVAYCLQD